MDYHHHADRAQWHSRRDASQLGSDLLVKSPRDRATGTRSAGRQSIRGLYTRGAGEQSDAYAQNANAYTRTHTHDADECSDAHTRCASKCSRIHTDCADTQANACREHTDGDSRHCRHIVIAHRRRHTITRRNVISPLRPSADGNTALWHYGKRASQPVRQRGVPSPQ